MKIYIIGNNQSNNNVLSAKLSELLDLKKFSFDIENNHINKIIKENREWIIESNYNEYSNVIAANSTTIIYLNVYKKSLFKNNINLNKKDIINEFVMKYSSKILILKGEKDIKKLIDAIYKGLEL